MPIITIADVAKAAGCSSYSVSCALRGTGQVSAARRALILETAERLGYRPNGPAAMLAGQRRRLKKAERLIPISFLGVRPRYQRGALYQGLREVCQRLGMKLHPFEGSEFGSIDQALKSLWNRGIEGIVLNPIALPWSEAAMAGANWNRFSVVKIGRSLGSLRFHLIRHSAFDYMLETLRRVFGRGFRRVGVILSDSSSTEDDLARMGALLGYREKLLPEGALLEILCLPAHSRGEGDSLRRWVEEWQPDALIVFPFAFCLDLMEAGCRIPGDFELASIITYGRLSGLPAITGCMSGDREFGLRAGARIFALMQAGERGMCDVSLQEVVEPEWWCGETMPA